MQGQAIATAADLPKLVGYQQLRELYGWPKRTVQEWIKARKFPKPLHLPGRGNYWTLEDIVVWMKGDLTRVAVTKPEDLKPDQLGDAAVDLLTRALEHEIGAPVDPAGIRITYGLPSPPVSEEQFAEAEAKEAAIFQRRFEGFDATRSSVMAAFLFPELRLMFADGAENDAIRRQFLDQEQLYRLALAAMNDISWEHSLAALNELSTQAGC